MRLFPGTIVTIVVTVLLFLFLSSSLEKLPTGIVSPLVVQCIAYLNHQECLVEPGLFRIPGDMSMMKQYRASFARGT